MLTLVQSYPALLLRRGKERALVVADLHIGWELALSTKGIHVPSHTPKMLNKLLKLIELCNPTILIFLGDVKHAIARVKLGEWRDIPYFFEGLSQKVNEIRVVLGNHDGNLEPLLPESVKVYPPTGLTFGDVALFHGNAWPQPESLQCRNLVMGHVHPTIAFRDQLGFQTKVQVWVKAKLDSKKLGRALLKSLGVKAKTGVNVLSIFNERYKTRLRASNLFIMPVFNDFLGGNPINRKIKEKGARVYLGPILRSGCLDLDRAEAYLLDGAFLGTVKQLRAYI